MNSYRFAVRLYLLGTKLFLFWRLVPSSVISVTLDGSYMKKMWSGVMWFKVGSVAVTVHTAVKRRIL